MISRGYLKAVNVDFTKIDPHARSEWSAITYYCSEHYY